VDFNHLTCFTPDFSIAKVYRDLPVAQVLASPLLRRLTAAAHHHEELVLWDPFCGSGVPWHRMEPRA